MHWCRRWLFTILLSAFGVTTFAQEADSLLLSGVDDALTFEDSLTIFNLIDSLLTYGEPIRSQFAVRLGYNSNVMSAGRTLGIENFGLAPAVSYYHKSGAYVDVSGFWSKDFEPAYYLTIASAGYMYSVSKRFSFMAEYDRYFYNTPGKDAYIPYKNTLSVTPMLEFKPLLLSVNYAYYFGDAHVHRIMPGLSVILEKRNLTKKIDRVAISPSFFALYGNETITSLEYVRPKNLRELLQNLRQTGTPYSMVQTSRNVFGIMNYAVSVPLMVGLKNWGFTFTYTYNIPKALSGEPLTLSESSFLSGSLTYFFKGFRKNKFPL